MHIKSHFQGHVVYELFMKSVNVIFFCVETHMFGGIDKINTRH